VLSELPDTTSLSRYCRQAMPRLCPFSVRTNSHVDVHQTLIVRSPDADTMYRVSKSTTLTAARCPTSTRRSVMSVGECMSHTAIDRSCTADRHFPALLRSACGLQNFPRNHPKTKNQFWMPCFLLCCSPNLEPYTYHY